MKKLFSILLFTLLLMLAVGAETLYGTELRTSTADPHLFVHDGYYYLARTGSTRVAVHKATSLLRLSTAYSSTEESIAYDASADPTVETLFGAGATISGTWSPEIHYFSEADFGAENAGWYMFVGLRKKAEAGSVYASEFVRLAVLKSTTGDPAGPYGHPQTGVVNHSMPLLAQSGEIYDEWACGQSILRIPEGKYAGLYAMWVDEVGRGTVNFYQRIRISKMASPWQLTGAVGTVTTPTQAWEFVGSEDGTHPKVVEGATAVYGKNGEVFLTYSGSGYWSDYGIGQLTWNGGDPLSTDSWVKYAHNPIFTATTATALRGAGHASFLTDTMGNGFFCYHAYPYSALSGKGSARNAYIEPYSIDYTANNGVGKGVLQLGSGVATTASTITFDTSGDALGVPTVTAKSGATVALTLSAKHADGYLLYRSTDNTVFSYLATVEGNDYTDEAVERGKTYYYRAYAYRKEEIGTAAASVSVKTTAAVAKPLFSVTEGEGVLTLSAYTNAAYDRLVFYMSAGGADFTPVYTAENVSSNARYAFDVGDLTLGETYYFYAIAFLDGESSDATATVSQKYTYIPRPTLTGAAEVCTAVSLSFVGEFGYDRFAVTKMCLNNPQYASFDDLTDRSFTDTDVAVGSIYAYYVFGKTGNYTSKKSNTVSVSVLGHSMELTEEEIPATTESEGRTALYTCTRCGETEGGEVIPMLRESGNGDANGDGKTTLLDLIAILRHVCDPARDIDTAAADRDASGTVDIRDVLLILQAILNTKV